MILFISYSTLENDIALIRLNKLVDTIFENYNLPIMPACLPLKENGITYEAKDFVVQGWGRTAPNFIDVCKDGECLIKRISDADTRSLGLSTRLPRKVDITKNNLEKCKEEFPENNLSEKQLCVGGEADKDSCQGNFEFKAKYKNEMKLLILIMAPTFALNYR